MWAYSKLDVKAPQLLDAIAAEVARQLPEFNAQNLANTVSGLASEARTGAVAMAMVGTPLWAPAEQLPT